jgi:hypothetical protein
MVQYANTTIMQMINTIKKSSKTQPIIIIQADEGPYPLEAPAQWQNATSNILKLKMGILAAYSLPGLKPGADNQINSSVDAFRFIFNNYFGASLKYLPDCSYVYNNSQAFTFYNISSKLHQQPPGCP